LGRRQSESDTEFELPEGSSLDDQPTQQHPPRKFRRHVLGEESPGDHHQSIPEKPVKLLPREFHQAKFQGHQLQNSNDSTRL
jgi:hypothetical protein